MHTMTGPTDDEKHVGLQANPGTQMPHVVHTCTLAGTEQRALRMVPTYSASGQAVQHFALLRVHSHHHACVVEWSLLLPSAQPSSAELHIQHIYL
jgi:hypothetical protein